MPLYGLSQVRYSETRSRRVEFLEGGKLTSVISFSPPRLLSRRWSTISFPSTLYLRPVLDLLLEDVPEEWQSEIRLGLQEALVNAAKHGNRLDPSKTVIVRFYRGQAQCQWIIVDEGTGFSPPDACNMTMETSSQFCDCGRGLYILHQIFDRVSWNLRGTELHLCKYWHRQPLV